MQSRAVEEHAAVKVSDSEEEAEERLAEMEVTTCVITVSVGNRLAVWRELMWPTPVIRRMLIRGMNVQFWQQITSINALVYNSPPCSRTPA